MKMFAPLLVCAACVIAVPSYAASTAPSGNPVIKTGGEACVGPLCVGTDRDRDRYYRHRHRDRDIDVYRHRDRDDYRYWR
jgi:hypothetical protein